MTPEELVELCRPAASLIARLGTEDPAALERALARLDAEQLVAATLMAAAEGWLTPKEAGGVRFGRLSKACEELGGNSLDAVDMDGPASGPHTHPRGEVELCIPVSGQPRFDGRDSRWVVYPPGSRHVPTVTGGRMLILYFLPGGLITWG